MAFDESQPAAVCGSQQGVTTRKCVPCTPDLNKRGPAVRFLVRQSICPPSRPRPRMPDRSPAAAKPWNHGHFFLGDYVVDKRILAQDTRDVGLRLIPSPAGTVSRG